MELAAALEATGIAQALRASRWSYPLVHIAHLVGLALLFGSIVPLDLRILGLWPRTDREALARVLSRVAATGLVLAVATGFALFSVRAIDYAAMPLFWAKMALVGIGAVNAVVARWRATRLTAALSILAWLGAIAAGRLLGYWSD